MNFTRGPKGRNWATRARRVRDKDSCWSWQAKSCLWLSAAACDAATERSRDVWTNHSKIRSPVFHVLASTKFAVRARLSPVFDALRRIRIPPSPPCSLDYRESLLLPLWRFANSGHLRGSRELGRTCKEATAMASARPIRPFFSAAENSTPTSADFQGET